MQLIERRIGLVFALFLLFLAGGALRSVWLGVVRADALTEAAAPQQTQTIDVPARRGSIVDRTGLELAVSEPAASVAATPYLIADPLKASRTLAPILGRPEGEILEKLSVKDSGFVWLARKLSADRSRRVRKL